MLSPGFAETSALVAVLEKKSFARPRSSWDYRRLGSVSWCAILKSARESGWLTDNPLGRRHDRR